MLKYDRFATERSSVVNWHSSQLCPYTFVVSIAIEVIELLRQLRSQQQHEHHQIGDSNARDLILCLPEVRDQIVHVERAGQKGHRYHHHCAFADKEGPAGRIRIVVEAHNDHRAIFSVLVPAGAISQTEDFNKRMLLPINCLTLFRS